MDTNASWWGERSAGSGPKVAGAQARSMVMASLAGPVIALASALTFFSGCVGTVGISNDPEPGGAGAPGGPGGSVQVTGAGGGGGRSGTGGNSIPPLGAGGRIPPGVGGLPVTECNSIAPGRTPLRRLTTYEYNNTVRDLLGDTMNPGSALPAQVDSKQNLFGNDANEQSPFPLLIEKYQAVAETIAGRATANAAALTKLHTCATA